MSDIGRSLAAIEAWYKHNAPELSVSLRPGLSENEIHSRLAEVDLSPTVALEALYGWHDGQAFGQVFFDYFSFYSLEQALDEYRQLRAVSAQLENDHGFVSWPVGRLPIFGFEGEYFALDLADIVVWYMMLEDSPRYWFDSLEQMLDFLARAFGQGLYQFAGGRLQGDAAALHTLRKTLVSAAADPGPLHHS